MLRTGSSAYGVLALSDFTTAILGNGYDFGVFGTATQIGVCANSGGSTHDPLK